MEHNKVGGPKPEHNRRLAALPADMPDLELISLPLGKSLYESGEILRYVYFPTGSIISVL